MRKCLRHKNIVPFLGATLDPPQFVSAWIPGGGLIEYVTTHPMVDRVRLVGHIHAVSGEVLTSLPAV